MSRYIDADAAIKRFEELHGNENTLLNSYNADWVVSFIEDRPTADVQEVKHGKWIVCGMFDDSYNVLVAVIETYTIMSLLKT